MRTTPSPTARARTRAARRSTRALAALAVAGAATMALASAPAGAAIGPLEPTPTPIPVPRPCAITIGGCRVETSFSFHHAGQAVWGSSTFTSSATGTVRYTLACPDGYTKTATVTLNGTHANAKLSNYGEHPDNQTCTVTQSVSSTWASLAYLGQQDPDDLYWTTVVEFFNAPKS
jgi:hypothetical protein